MLWPLVVYSFAVVALGAAMIGISYFLGERHKERVTNEPYESGIIGVESARLRFSVKFYLIAMFFVIFDVESIFIFVWAIAFRQAGWAGYVGILIFIAVLLAALVYLWRVGALDWTKKILPQSTQRTQRKI
jgi:NADH-quinone oxidoreductase subunit A